MSPPFESAEVMCPVFTETHSILFSVRILMGCTTVNQAWLSITVRPAFCWEGNNLCRLYDISEKSFPQPFLCSNDIKAIVHPKMEIPPSFTHFHFVPNPCYFNFLWNTCSRVIYFIFFQRMYW